MSNSELKTISLGDISISETNPRKTFDEDSLKELTLSVKQHGILQPILVRPIPDGVGTKNQQLYELVCGERRYRAAKTARLKQIPANIRELSDDEAFELQIIENLERKDVHPIEEAEAFKRMLDSGKYSVEDISAKIVKSDKYVVQRLKLNDLIDSLKEDFYKGHFGVGHAVMLARLDHVIQEDQYQSAHSGWKYNGDNPDYGTIEQLRDDIEEDLYNLNNAPFDLNDETFKENKCACSVCPKHAAVNPLLFPDVEEKDKCFDTDCYESKQRQYVERRVAQIINNGEDIYLGLSWRAEASDFIKELCKQHNIKILTDDDWRRVYDDGKKENAPKMLLVGGTDAGKILPVHIQKSANVKNSTHVGPTIEEQIRKIESRASRSLELDNEKVEAALRAKLDSYLEKSKFVTGEEFKDKIELSALLFCIYESFGYKNREWLVTKFYKDKYISDYSGIKMWNKINSIDLSDGKLINEALRRLILKVLTDRQVSDRSSNGYSDAFYKLFQLYHPIDLKIIQSEQDDLASKRIERTDAKIEKLKKELEE